jgi:hypothetical protein
MGLFELLPASKETNDVFGQEFYSQEQRANRVKSWLRNVAGGRGLLDVAFLSTSCTGGVTVPLPGSDKRSVAWALSQHRLTRRGASLQQEGGARGTPVS